MRKKLFAAGAAFCMLGMTGCSNDMVEDGASQAGKQVMMTLQSTTDGPQTRADYTDDNTKMNFSWRSGDELSVVVDGVTGNENKKLTATANGKSAPFSGEVMPFSDTKTIYAFYPYSATPYVVTGGDNSATATVALILPNPQTYTVATGTTTTGAITNSFMVGVGTAKASNTDITASASLKQVMSIIKLNITKAPGKVTGVKLKCTDAMFATTATVKLSDATITSPGNLVNELSMTVTDNSTDHTAVKAISFAIFPKAKMDGKKIQIEVTYEGGKSKMIEKDDIAFARNMHYVMDFDGTPAANDYIEVNGIKVAVGNLVANGANGAKIGTATDGGLYFQFGSLIGWAGGVNGDGTGMPASDTPDYAFNSAGTVVPSGSIPSTFDDPNKWSGTTGTVPAENDPCTHYLGSGWRLPTGDEYETLFKDNDYFDHSGPWTWNGTSKSATHTDGLTFPASGYRGYNDSSLNRVGTDGFYWSASPYDDIDGYSLNFTSDYLFPDNVDYRTNGLPVRCVRASN